MSLLPNRLVGACTPSLLLPRELLEVGEQRSVRYLGDPRVLAAITVPGTPWPLAHQRSRIGLASSNGGRRRTRRVVADLLGALVGALLLDVASGDDHHLRGYRIAHRAVLQEDDRSVRVVGG